MLSNDGCAEQRVVTASLFLVLHLLLLPLSLVLKWGRALIRLRAFLDLRHRDFGQMGVFPSGDNYRSGGIHRFSMMLVAIPLTA
jgi:hypothetical protein